jgi:hypothetical protein
MGKFNKKTKAPTMKIQSKLNRILLYFLLAALAPSAVFASPATVTMKNAGKCNTNYIAVNTLHGNEKKDNSIPSINKTCIDVIIHTKKEMNELDYAQYQHFIETHKTSLNFNGIEKMTWLGYSNSYVNVSLKNPTELSALNVKVSLKVDGITLKKPEWEVGYDNLRIGGAESLLIPVGRMSELNEITGSCVAGFFVSLQDAFNSKIKRSYPKSFGLKQVELTTAYDTIFKQKITMVTKVFLGTIDRSTNEIPPAEELPTGYECL